MNKKLIDNKLCRILTHLAPGNRNYYGNIRRVQNLFRRNYLEFDAFSATFEEKFF